MSTRRIVDLSHPIREGMVTYPGLPGPVLGEHLSFEASHDVYAPGTEFAIGRIEMVANTGTYLDTPAHRWRGGHDLSGISPLERCADLPAFVVDAPAEGPADDAIVAALGHAGADAVRDAAVIVRTGWSRHFGTEAYGDGGHPYVGEPGVRALLDAGPALVGIDSVNIDATGPDAVADRPAHTRLLEAEVLIVEHLTNLDTLPLTGARFTAAPPAVVGLATFPVRAFAVLPSDAG